MADGGKTIAEGGAMPSIVAAAHELKSPLVLIRQLAMELEEGSLSDSERERVLQQIALTSERGLRLTTDLTRSVRLDGGLFDLEPINSIALCERASAEIAPLFKAHDVTLRIARVRSAPPVVGNRDLLSRIILNLCDNALYYASDQGTVDLIVKVREKGSIVRVGVRDHGPAVSRQVWREVKQRLARAPQAINMRPLSSGLGLYIVQQFAEAMGAQIGAVRHGDGCTFFVDMKVSSQMSLI